MSEDPSGVAPSTASEAEREIVNFIRTRDMELRADEDALRANALPGVVFDASDDGMANKVLRRNQVLYCLGQIELGEFRYSDVERWLRERFPDSNQGQVLNVTTALAELAQKGILVRNAAADAYMLREPVLRSALQTLLHCAEGSETVKCGMPS